MREPISFSLWLPFHKNVISPKKKLQNFYRQYGHHSSTTSTGNQRTDNNCSAHDQLNRQTG